MRWLALQRRLAAWFAEALTNGEMDLAARLAALAVWLRDSDIEAPEALGVLLDHLELGETAGMESNLGAHADGDTIRAIVADLEELLFRWDRGMGDGGTAMEAAVVYRWRARARSSRRANVGNEMPSAEQTSRSSRMSSLRSPDSYLLTND